VNRRTDATGPLDVHLADGGHVIIAFGDEPARIAATNDGVFEAVIHADGSEGDLERAIVAEATADGLAVHVSGSHHPTTLVIESRSDGSR
jgi:hypothetical protein